MIAVVQDLLKARADAIRGKVSDPTTWLVLMVCCVRMKAAMERGTDRRAGTPLLPSHWRMHLGLEGEGDRKDGRLNVEIGDARARKRFDTAEGKSSCTAGEEDARDRAHLTRSEGDCNVSASAKNGGRRFKGGRMMRTRAHRDYLREMIHVISSMRSATLPGAVTEQNN